ncbi:MAG: disulfide bond formation protein B [Gammaproteobacteria bacterium]|nr:disulfide bond formation protein B [Gammaproteobacteria bacterium]
MYRILNLSVVVIVVASILFALYYLEAVLFLEPCPLCMVDRVILLTIAAICLIAFIHNSSGVMRWLYTSFATLFGLAGVGVAARHIWLQGLPPEEVPECGPDLTYMLEVFPLGDVIKRIFTGSGECAEVSWTFLGMTIPQQTLLLFIVLIIIVLVAHMQTQKR